MLIGANWGGATFPGSWARHDRTPKRPWNKARHGPPRPCGQNWADGGHRHPLLWRRGSEELPGAGTLELGFGGCEAEGQEEHSTWEEARVQGCEAAVSSVCLNDRPEDACVAEVEGAKWGVTGCGEGPGFYPESTREPRGSKEQERDQVRWAFFKSPLGNGS